MINMTYELAHAAGHDAASRHMRKEGRNAWNEGDFDIAVQTMNSLMGAAANASMV